MAAAFPVVPGLVEGDDLIAFLRSCPTMDQVAGLEDEKKEVKRILSRSATEVKEANNFILLAGVSGTGKTVLARAIVRKLIGQKSATYFCIEDTSGSPKIDSVEILDSVFEEVMKRKPSILHIRYMNAIIPRISMGPTGTAQDTKIAIATRFITHLRQLQYENQVYVIGVTPRPFEMRPAALRLFRHGVIYCPPPTGYERCQLLRIFLARLNYKLTDDQIMAIGFNPAADWFSRWDILSLVGDISRLPPIQFPQGIPMRDEQQTFIRNAIHERLFRALMQRRGSVRPKDVQKVVSSLRTQFPGCLGTGDVDETSV